MTNSTLRPLVKIHGGKGYLTKWLASYCPKKVTDMRLFDIYGGAGTFLLRMPRCRAETYNDIDPDLFNLVWIVANRGEEFIQAIKKIDYSEQNFKLYLESEPTDVLEKSVREAVIRRMSRGGLMNAFSYSERLRGGIPGDTNAWNTWRNGVLPKIVERFQGVTIRNQDGVEILLNDANTSDSFCYIDPPYLHSTRTAKKAYRNEMTEEQHKIMLSMAVESKAKIMISGYDSPLYRKMLKGWKMHCKPMPNHSSQAKNKESRVECVWLNY